MAAVIILAQLGCTIAPRTGVSSGPRTSEEEIKLISMSNRRHQELKSRGLIQDDPVLQSYVTEIGHRIVLASNGKITDFQFHILRDPTVNASADANGRIYLHLGLLTRVQNESQLAFVISHEISHVLKNHPLQQLQNRKINVMTGHLVDLLLGGIGFGYIPAVAATMSYSRSQEFEADQHAIIIMAQAGYDPNQAVLAIELINEVKSVESIPGSLYATHPENPVRIERLKSLVSVIDSRKRSAKPELSQFAGMRTRVMDDYLPLKLSRKRYELTLDTLRRELPYDPENAMLHYYTGEAHRMIAEDPSGAAREHAWLYGKKKKELEQLEKEFNGRVNQELNLAEQAYRKTLELDESFWKAYRGLGLVARDRGQFILAKQFLSLYLEKGGKVKDKRYIEGVIRKLESLYD